MYRESLGRRRGSSFNLYDQVLCINRALIISPATIHGNWNPLSIPAEVSTKVMWENDHGIEDRNLWLPNSNHLDTTLNQATKTISSVYVNLLNDALSEVTKLEKELADQKAAEEKAALLAKKQAEASTNDADLNNNTEKSISHSEANGTPLLAQSTFCFADGSNAMALKATSDISGNVSLSNSGSDLSLRDLDTARTDTNVSTTMDEQKPYCPNNAYTRQIDEYQREYENLKKDYDTYVKSTDPNIKKTRIDIARQINATVNKLANTQKQINHSYNTLVNLSNQYKNDPSALTYLTFRVIDTVLELCEPGCQMYLNPKAVWASAHLIRGLMSLHNGCRAIYWSHVKRDCPYALPRLYESSSEKELEELHKCNMGNVNSYLKKQTAIVRFHLALLVVTEDSRGIWSWFSGFLNACTRSVFRIPLSGIISTALSTAAYQGFRTYREQFRKVSRNHVM
uniref:mRNA export factor GLE1 n=1 Tax=Babesia bovis TaxID=5865 RepID=A7AWF0_BABBO|eukprot:XP_001608946.1 hypothetical protein [Babesia bovis T2Bo]